MTAVGIAARRVKLRCPPVASVEGGVYSFKRKMNNTRVQIRRKKSANKLEQVDTPEIKNTKDKIRLVQESSPTTRDKTS